MARALSSAFSRISCASFRNITYASKLQQNLFKVPFILESRLFAPSLLHVSSQQYGLMEFFDNQKNWGEENVKSGRPWRLDELRIKSNSDLHKLWYVLLKERNMLLTMKHEYEHQCELLPSPERIEKVEESMENIMAVVKERNEAVTLLETGKTGDPGGRYIRNYLGIKQWKKNTEHLIPHYMNKFYFLLYPRYVTARTLKYLALYREQQRIDRRKAENREKRWKRRMEEHFPHLKGKL